MSLYKKTRKLITNPKGFWDDSIFNKDDKPLPTKYEGKTVAFAFKINHWKREFIEKNYPEYYWHFVPFKKSVESLDQKIQKIKDKVFIIWGYNELAGTVEYARKYNIPVYRMEDGFVRSVGLGANHELPLSLVLDKSGTLYFDSRSPSTLENILNEYDFASNSELMSKAETYLKKLLNTRSSKYNHVASKNAGNIYSKYCTKNNGAKRILVVGQVEDDASIKYGCSQQLNNGALVWKARSDHPDAQIFFKPHPDVLAGKRKAITPISELKKMADVIAEPFSLSDSLSGIDEVYTITSLSGFEAILRDIPVTTLGEPFYSGWGLTNDAKPNLRRKRKLNKLELFAAAYILYPDYFDPYFNSRSSLDSTLLYIDSCKNGQHNKSSICNILELAESKAIEGDKEEFVRLINSAVEVEPNNPTVYRKRATLYRSLGIYEEVVIDDLKKVIELSKKPKISYFNTLINQLWICDGVSPLMLDTFAKRNDLFKGKLSTFHWLRYAAALSDAGYPSRAEEAYRNAVKVSKKRRLDPKYTILGSTLYKLDPQKYKEFHEYHVFYEMIRSNFINFEKLMRENYGSVCVVGNSPCDLGCGNGSKIDSHNIVVRFNNFATDHRFSNDYGQKTNVWVKAGSFREVKRRDLQDFKQIIISGSNHLSRTPRCQDLFLEFMWEGVNASTFPPEIVYEVYRNIKTPPSAGIIMLYWLYKTNGPLDINSVYGFSFTDQNRGVSSHYFEDTKKGDYRHDWDAEERFFKTLLKEEPLSNNVFKAA